MVQVFESKMENVEVRAVEREDLNINGKIYPRLKVSIDDKNGMRVIFIDKHLDRLDSYKRGQMGTLILKNTIEQIVKDFKSGSQGIGEKIKMEIEDFILEQ